MASHKKGHTALPVINVSIFGNQGRGLVDTGSSRTIISMDLVNEIVTKQDRRMREKAVIFA